MMMDTTWSNAYVEGWRVWTIVSQPPMVRPINSYIAASYVWKAGPNRAKHEQMLTTPIGTQHRAPARGCTCGLHAFKMGVTHDIPGLQAWYTLAVGKVRMWGNVDEYARGYRAEFAEVTEIWDVATNQRLPVSEGRPIVRIDDPRLPYAKATTSTANIAAEYFQVPIVRPDFAPLHDPSGFISLIGVVDVLKQPKQDQSTSDLVVGGGDLIGNGRQR